MCIIEGQFWLTKDKEGVLKIWTPTCSCAIIEECEIVHGSFFRVGVEYEKVPRSPKIKPKPKKITPTPLPVPRLEDMGLPAMEIDMFFIKDLHAEEPAPQTQTLVELPPEIGMLKQLQELTGGNLLAAAAILLGFMWLKMQQKNKKDSDEVKCGHTQEKCDRAHAELSDVLKKMELDVKDVKQVQLNLFDSLEFAEDVSRLKIDVKNLQEKVK